MTYAALGQVRGWLGIVDQADDVELGLALAAAEAAIDAHCGYSFDIDASPAARVFAAHRPDLLDVAAAGLPIGTSAALVIATDDNADGVFETTWASADYQLEPLNGRGQGGAVWPYTVVRAVGDRSFPVDAGGRALVQITARFGWPAVPTRVRTASIMLTAAWHQRRATVTGRSGFDGFFSAAIEDDNAVRDLLEPLRHGASLGYGLG